MDDHVVKISNYIVEGNQILSSLVNITRADSCAMGYSISRRSTNSTHLCFVTTMSHSWNMTIRFILCLINIGLVWDVIDRDSKGNSGGFKAFDIAFMTNKQVVTLFKHGQCLMGIDPTCNITEILTKIIKHMVSKIIIREWLINKTNSLVSFRYLTMSRFLSGNY